MTLSINTLSQWLININQFFSLNDLQPSTLLQPNFIAQLRFKATELFEVGDPALTVLIFGGKILKDNEDITTHGKYSSSIKFRSLSGCDNNNQQNINFSQLKSISYHVNSSCQVSKMVRLSTWS